MRVVITGILLGCVLGLSSCSSDLSAQTTTHWPISQLDYIGQTVVAHNRVFEHTIVGGLSSIDYDKQHQQWVMISDDRSEESRARAYVGKMTISAHQVSPMKFTQVITLKGKLEKPYPNLPEYLLHHQQVVPDLESLRIDPQTHLLRYTSEGDRKLGLNPFIRDANWQGEYIDSLALPAAILKSPQHGFRDNLALEGSSFSDNGRYYFTSMEAPLIQDGPVPSLTQGAFGRVLKYDRAGVLLAEYVYPIDKLPAKPGLGRHADNGVSEMLAIDDTHFLMLERSGIQNAAGQYHDYIRIYQADATGATNVRGEDKLVAGHFQPMRKRLLLNFESLHLPHIDNIEGISFGPRLPDGSRTLVVISDNNFNASEVTQILAFKVVMAD
ncbi:esterase-like activity of phytase family protein [Celerinatantimonas yamalensis]|uniref:Esterase-like activity of phytase family protein n=1 Tax=Celerinatantimonas yamalensis TaxID=559956 RepID=A0ABW9GB69_9GAMM